MTSRSIDSPPRSSSAPRAPSLRFSPDGQSIGSWSPGGIREVPLGGGPRARPCRVADLARVGGRRLLHARRRLLEVPPRRPRGWRLDSERGGVDHRLPQVLQGSDADHLHDYAHRLRVRTDGRSGSLAQHQHVETARRWSRRCTLPSRGHLPLCASGRAAGGRVRSSRSWSRSATSTTSCPMSCRPPYVQGDRTVPARCPASVCALGHPGLHHPSNAPQDDDRDPARSRGSRGAAAVPPRTSNIPPGPGSDTPGAGDRRPRPAAHRSTISLSGP